ncbi:caspase-1-like [Culex pipiens pallens]|uniref:caspase-1-like n=1 Tax=Culex pipiens pallens TaxID=42434 RepID=UPI0022AAFBBE|nr:caspase-1-like [Culex pipiens pallens]
MNPTQLPEIDTVVADLKRKRSDDILPTSNGLKSTTYAMNGTKSGKVLIFNQVECAGESPRRGSDEDVKKLFETLPKLGFLQRDIKECKNYTKDQIYEEVSKLDDDKELYDADCLMVVILTHGRQGDALMASDQLYHLYDLIDQFTPLALPSMAGKPKIFIVQACRGDREDSGVNLYVVNNHGLSCTQEDNLGSQTHTFTYPEYADLLIMMSSHYDHVSYRSTVRGSWFIQHLCSVI